MTKFNLKINYLYSIDLLVDKLYPLNLLNNKLLNAIALSIRFKRFKHNIAIATILLLKKLFNYNNKLICNYLNYSDRKFHIDIGDFIGIYIYDNINYLKSIYYMHHFKSISLIDDTIEFNKIYYTFFSKLIILKKKYNNLYNKLQIKKINISSLLSIIYQINAYNKYNNKIINIITLKSYLNFSMRDLMSCYYMTNDWMIVSYIFDKDILYKEYNGIFQIMLNSIINNIQYFNQLYISYYMPLYMIYNNLNE
jgi:hypothetical protein